MSETLELERASEVVDAPTVPNVPAVVDPLQESALADLTSVERGLSQLRTEHGSTSYDITTPHGYKLATARRHAIRLVRFQVPKTVKAQKARLRDIADAVESEGERIVAELRKIEDPHDALITAEDERKAAIAKAKAEAEAAAAAEAARIEAERVQRHRDNIATIRLYLAKAQGLSSDRILRGMDMLSTVSLEGFEEFKAEAEAAMSETANAMSGLYREAVAREEEAARLAYQKAEQERIAAEQKAEAERLAAQRAEIERQAAELAAARAESERLERLADERRKALAVEAAEGMIRAASPVDQSTGEILTNTQEGLVPGTPGPCASNTAEAAAVPSGSEGTVAPAEVRAAEPAQVAEPLTLSAIGLRLGFPITQAFLAKLGVQPTAKAKAAVLYAETLWPTIKAALVKHIEGLA